MILYHIMADTGCLPEDVVPQIPTNRMKGEDQEIPRICLGHTLDDCLTSIGIAHFVSKFLLAELRQNKKYSKDMPLPFIVRMYNMLFPKTGSGAVIPGSFSQWHAPFACGKPPSSVLPISAWF